MGIQGTAAGEDNNKQPASEDDTTPPESPTLTPPIVFELGDNVLTEWSARKYYYGHVCGVGPSGYDVYFPDDAKVKCKLQLHQLKPMSRPRPRRADMIDRVFYHEEPYEEDRRECPVGRWKVRRLDNKVNEFCCVRVSGDDGGGRSTCDTFDIRYVMRELQKQDQEARSA